jgi:hypothetical protein
LSGVCNTSPSLDEYDRATLQYLRKKPFMDWVYSRLKGLRL